MDQRAPLTYLKVAILFVFIATVFVSVSVVSRLPFRYRQCTNAGQPYIEMQDIMVAGEITSIAADNSYIYCCWGKRHIVKVYDFDGRHVSTVAISDKHNKGGALMVGSENQMAVLFSGPHCYYFKAGNFVSFDPQGNQRNQLVSVRNATDAAGSTYSVQHGCVVKQTAGGDASMFVSSPPVLRFMTSVTMRIAGSLLMICLLIVHAADGRKWTIKGKAED